MSGALQVCLLAPDLLPYFGDIGTDGTWIDLTAGDDEAAILFAKPLFGT